MSEKLIGPFSQIVTLRNLPRRGAMSDEQLEIIPNGAVRVQDGIITELGEFEMLRKKNPNAPIEEIQKAYVLLPGFVDSHTHLCFSGSRAADYAARNAGKSYLDIAKAGGGIWSSVQMTRNASEEQLISLTVNRIQKHLSEGVTTIEIKSGYGLSFEEEVKILRAIQKSSLQTPATLLATCLAAHTKPRDFEGSNTEYLHTIEFEWLPSILKEGLTNRIDIFVEESAFGVEEAREFLKKCSALGMQLTVHGDQFTPGGSRLGVELGALSVDHLEASTDQEIKLLGNSSTVATVLPGASLGLGMHFAPARKLLDAGAILSIASDWNPGSAPMGNLLCEAALLGAYEKLTSAEIFAGLTFRAAAALGLSNLGSLEANFIADLQAYPTSDYREILYLQGAMKPSIIWKKGVSLQNY